MAANQTRQRRSKSRKTKYSETWNSNTKSLNLYYFENHSSLTTWQEIPAHLQFNLYILTGYRKMMSWKECLSSLFFLHNETGNIITHAPIAIYTLICWRSFWPWDSLMGKPYFYGLGISHTIAMIVPWIPSFIYHLFMCHSGGRRIYKILLTCDVLAIWMTEFFGSLTNIAATIWKLPESTQGLLMGIFCIGSGYGLAKCLKASSPRQRVICFAPLFISRVLSILFRLTPWGGGEWSILSHVILQDLTSIAGGFIGVARVPERWLPGNFDYFANSHNIMHILVILAVWHMNQAANGDIRWIISQKNSISSNFSTPFVKS